MALRRWPPVDCWLAYAEEICFSNDSYLPGPATGPDFSRSGRSVYIPRRLLRSAYLRTKTPYRSMTVHGAN